MEVPSIQLKKRILERDSYICGYCYRKLDVEHLQIDHIHPRSLGGSNLPKNLITSCIRCNNKKGNRLLSNPPKVKGLRLRKGDLVNEHSYPKRAISLSDELWNDLKFEKLKSGKTWTNFLRELLTKL